MVDLKNRIRKMTGKSQQGILGGGWKCSLSKFTPRSVTFIVYKFYFNQILKQL
jgi:hypothetical protein